VIHITIGIINLRIKFHASRECIGRTNPITGGRGMEANQNSQAVLEVPTLWADHHVLKVRDALVNLEGVDGVYASSAWKQVLVSYDSAKTDLAAIEKTLAEAGYPVGQGEIPVLVQPGEIRRDPQWEVLGLRMTETVQADIQMSGEFRRY
jgi:copper chaperone CopZ